MRVYHFALIFLVFFFAVVIKTDINIGKMEAIETEKMELIESLNSATSDAIDYLAASGEYGASSIVKEEVANTFFTSLYSSLGVVSDPNQRTEIDLYIPVILLCDTDGFYVYYYDDYKDANGQSFSKRVWSEKIPYHYQDDDLIYGFTLTDQVDLYDINNYFGGSQRVIKDNYHAIQNDASYQSFRRLCPDNILLNDEKFEMVRKTAIMIQLEEVLSYYTFKHNSIARQNGITYQFSFPAGEEDEWAQYLDDINLIVVFQGYPYGMDNNYTFNKIASSGANIIRKPTYYVEKKSWYLLAHKKGCPKLEGNPMVLEETFDNLYDCAKIGAYCDDCIDNGPRAPILK